MAITTTVTVGEIQQRITEVLRGCPNGQLEEGSLRAACLLHAEIEDMQGMLRLLQRGEINASVGPDGGIDSITFQAV